MKQERAICSSVAAAGVVKVNAQSTPASSAVRRKAACSFSPVSSAMSILFYFMIKQNAEKDKPVKYWKERGSGTRAQLRSCFPGLLPL